MAVVSWPMEVSGTGFGIPLGRLLATGPGAVIFAGGGLFICVVSFCEMAGAGAIAGEAFFPGLRKSHSKKSTPNKMMIMIKRVLFF